MKNFYVMLYHCLHANTSRYLSGLCSLVTDVASQTDWWSVCQN